MTSAVPGYPTRRGSATWAFARQGQEDGRAGAREGRRGAGAVQRRPAPARAARRTARRVRPARTAPVREGRPVREERRSARRARAARPRETAIRCNGRSSAEPPCPPARLSPMRPYEGLLTAMVTPFAARRQRRRGGRRRARPPPARHGSDGLVVCGTTGEAATLTDDEHIGMVELIASELGDAGTIVAGDGSNDTRHAVELTERALAAGRRRRAVGHAVLQQAEPPRHHAPLRGASPRPPPARR